MHTPIDFRVSSLGQDTLDQILVEDLLEVLRDEGEPLVGAHVRHGAVYLGLKCFSVEFQAGGPDFDISPAIDDESRIFPTKKCADSPYGPPNLPIVATLTDGD